MSIIIFFPTTPSNQSSAIDWNHYDEKRANVSPFLSVKELATMYEKFLSIIRKTPLISGDSSYAQLFRTYIVGGLNLVIALVFHYIFQFFILYNISVPLRTYLTNLCSFSIGVIISYFLSRKVIFKLSASKGRVTEFINFLITNLINLILPVFIWFLIDRVYPSIQENEMQFLIAAIIIHTSIIPIKYVLYKFFVFKDSLNN